MPGKISIYGFRISLVERYSWPLFIAGYDICEINVSYTCPRGLALKIKAQRLFSSDKSMGVFPSSRQVNAIRGVCGGDSVKRVVCR